MAKLPTLTTAGAVLRPLKVTDAVALFIAHGDARSHTYWSSPAHNSIDETAEYILQTLRIPGAYGWSITESGGEALGRIGLFVAREGVADIGIIMRPDATGRGFASKALNLVVAFGFDKLGLHRIGADIDPDNASSISLFLRAGFQREGVLRGNWKTHLGIRDTVIMAKLKD